MINGCWVWRWKDVIYIDMVLPIGLRSAPKVLVFNALADALEWTLHVKVGVTHNLHYLDDFLILARAENR